MRVQLTPKVVRRLLAADGYLDLGLSARAVAELEQISEAGPLEGPRQLLLGIARKQSGDFPAAIRHLELAARKMPRPIRSFVWRELIEAYRAVGSEELAAMAETLAGSASYQLTIQLPHSGRDLELLSGRAVA
jgi:tetratricopeptide (TPR) repeat protein